MAWYTASIFLKSIHLSRPQVPPLWEERILLIDASSDTEAKTEATRIGKTFEHEYEVFDGQPGDPPGKLRWHFETVESVVLVESDQLVSGTEIFSRYLRESSARSILTRFGETETS